MEALEPPLDFSQDEMRCLSTLLAHGVRFLLVGGFAVRYHGYLRVTKDVDVLTGNNEQDADAVCAAVTEILGFQHPNVVPEQITGRKRQINFSDHGLDFEILTAIDEVGFDEIYNKRCMASLDNLEIPVISKPDLIGMKKRSRRPQDLEDVKHLESRAE